jgi:hypothetical protein
MRQGKYTGTLYPDNYDFSTVTECCTCVSERDAMDEESVNARHLKDLMQCVVCCGCPTAQKGIV